MSCFTFVHAADLHLDTPFEGLGRVAPAAAEVLRDSSIAAWDALVALCLDRGVDMLLLAGDIYDGEERGLRAQMRFLRGLQRLSERGVRVFVAHGNHDPHGGRWTAIRDWPPGVTVFGHESVDSVVVHDDSGREVAVVHGISHASREVTENLAVRFSRGGGACPHLGVLHCNVDGNLDHPAYAPCTRADLLNTGMDYWALGHIHRHQVLANNGPWIVYAGGLQGRSLKPAESGVKGAVLGTIENGAIGGVRFVPVPHVRFADLQVDIAETGDIGRLVERLHEEAQALEQQAPCAGLVLRATLTGRGALHADLGSSEAAADLLKTLREEADGHRLFTWWSEIVVRTQQDLDRDAVRRRRDFSAELMAYADGLRADADAFASVVQDAERDLRAGVLRRWVDDIHSNPERLLDEAETLALEQLEERSGQ
jgi:DNA repair protein SbcD/Mre11